jgi:hypothetical protein
MKANKSGRNIKIRDYTTGEIITVKPKGLIGKFKSIFKERAIMDFDQAKGKGHYTTGRGV